MKNYRYDKNKNGKFDIIEKPTEQIIMSFDTKEKAKERTTELNKGRGFDGFTPSFFLRKFKK